MVNSIHGASINPQNETVDKQNGILESQSVKKQQITNHLQNHHKNEGKKTPLKNRDITNSALAKPHLIVQENEQQQTQPTLLKALSFLNQIPNKKSHIMAIVGFTMACIGMATMPAGILMYCFGTSLFFTGIALHSDTHDVQNRIEPHDFSNSNENKKIDDKGNTKKQQTNTESDFLISKKEHTQHGYDTNTDTNDSSSDNDLSDFKKFSQKNIKDQEEEIMHQHNKENLAEYIVSLISPIIYESKIPINSPEMEETINMINVIIDLSNGSVIESDQAIKYITDEFDKFVTRVNIENLANLQKVKEALSKLDMQKNLQLQILITNMVEKCSSQLQKLENS